MENLIKNLEKYLQSLNVEQLYTDPGHENSKNWLAGVTAVLKVSGRHSYKDFKNLSQHIYPSIPLETRRHAAEQIDVFFRRIIAQYKMEFVTNSNTELQESAENKIEKIKIFLSYSTKNKVGVGKIKSWLYSFGFEVFLAHEDIEPSLEWQKAIIKELKECHIFIPVITQQFNESDWTDQESGMAFITNKKIIPISVEGFNPHGFIGIYQASPMNQKSVETDCIKLIRAIKNDSQYSSIVIDLLIKNLIWGKSSTFASAEWKTAILAECDSFTKEQFASLLKVAIENNQVHYAAGSREDLKSLIKKYRHLVNLNLLEKLNKIDKDFKFG